jgi:hypothetical protein
VPLYGDLAVRNAPADAEVFVNIASDDTTTVWRVFNQGLPSDPVRLPKLPSGIDPRVVLGTGRITARALACLRDPTTGDCAELSVSESADLVSP